MGLLGIIGINYASRCKIPSTPLMWKRGWLEKLQGTLPLTLTSDPTQRWVCTHPPAGAAEQEYLPTHVGTQPTRTHMRVCRGPTHVPVAGTLPTLPRDCGPRPPRDDHTPTHTLTRNLANGGVYVTLTSCPCRAHTQRVERN